MDKAVILARVSTDKQEYHRQVSELKSFCQKMDWHIVGTFTNKINGAESFENRTELRDMIEFVRSNEVKRVVCLEISRLGRNTPEALKVIQILNENKVSLYREQNKTNSTKMKTLRMVGTAMMAVLMGIGFTSCSKDDNPNGSEKNLVKMVGSAGGIVGETWTSTYDDQGRVTSAILDSEFGLEAQFLRSDDVIVVSNDYSQPYTLSLNNGLVQSGSNGDTFTYNSSNRMTKWNHRTIMWDSDKVVPIGDDSFTYGTTCKKGYFSLIPYFIDDVEHSMLLFTANPEIAGLETKQLPTKVYNIPTTYEFDKEEYISKISLNRADGASLVYTLTWE